VLIEHRGEAEYDFRHTLHASFRTVVLEDVGEALRLTKQLLMNPATRLAAVVAGWERPVSIEAFLFASLYTAWSGHRHPLMPTDSDNETTDVEIRLADLALENMNRR
jgi:hypothetical protein